ncbi:hypothetical protein [Aeromonas rivipollensis]|uniref:hypothetical protein n=1 Tax=Aeromonas rivipollensis TaxID=948519 RepID=UPI003D1FF716
MECIDLFPLLHNRMIRENQSTPEYIGEFNGVGSLPRGDYPGIYFWMDSYSNNIRLSFNTPKLERWCIEEASANGFNVELSDSSIKQALATLEQVATPAFAAMIDEVQRIERNIQQVEAHSEEQSKSKKWWKFW